MSNVLLIIVICVVLVIFFPQIAIVLGLIIASIIQIPIHIIDAIKKIFTKKE